MEYAYTPDMASITTLGDGHDAPPDLSGWDEETCRAMVIAGVQYLDAHPNLDPVFNEFDGYEGLMVTANEEADRLVRVLQAVGGNAKIPMRLFTLIIRHTLAAKSLGWEEYARAMRGLKGMRDATKE